MKKKIIYILIILSFLFPTTSAPFLGATSYTNAKEFYESTSSNGQSFHAEVLNGTIYYATCAKLAQSTSSLHYSTIGFDITLSGNGHSVSFAVERTDGSMKQIGEAVQSNGNEYILYRISDTTLFELATTSNPSETSYIFEAPYIQVTMDAILVTKKGTNVSGGISEDGKGGLTQWGTIYRLKNSSDLSALKSIFTGHLFNSYYDIESELANYQLQIRYHTQGYNSTSSTVATVGNGYSIQDDLLFQNEETYIQKQRILQRTTLLNPSSVSLEKEGYHLESGKEWITADRRVFSINTEYMPSTIDPIVGQQNHGITLFANWQPNTYTVTYHPNEGNGIVPSNTFTFDQSDYLRANTFSKTGYYLESGAEWNTEPDGSGTSYGSEELVINLASDLNKEVILYANWKPISVSIHTEKKEGTGGTDTFYQLYNHGFFSDVAHSANISHISIPFRTGYTFNGYYKSFFPSDNKLIDETGAIKIPNTYFLNHAVIYADYDPNTYKISFDKQGGAGGSDFVNPIYDSQLPFAESPTKNGASFKGYFTEPNGQGAMFYNEFMATDIIYKTDGDMILYAYWKDETPPEVFLTTNFDSWTNRSISLTALSADFDSGLVSVELYCDNQSVAKYSNLKGQKNYSFTFQNAKEGVIGYRLIAIDMAGNKSETSQTIYYDKKAPTGSVTQHTKSGNTLSITVSVTDINVP